MRRIPYMTSLLILGGPLAWGCQANGQASQFETTRIAEDVYQFRFEGHNTLFAVTSAGVVAFDPISVEAAGHLADAIQEAAPGQPLLAVIYSHHHADHASGADVLRTRLGAAPIIAHENAVDDLAQLDAPDLPMPDVTFSDAMTLHHGGTEIQLHYLGNSHSDNMIVGVLPQTGVAFAVDYIANDRVGYQDLPGWMFPDVFETLQRTSELEFETMVFGHGPPGDMATIDRQVAYYAALRAAVEEAVEAGLSEDEAAASVRLDEFSGFNSYDEWFALNVRGMYRWVASR